MRLFTNPRAAAESLAFSFGQMQWSWQRSGNPPTANAIEKEFAKLKAQLEKHIAEGSDIISVRNRGLCVSVPCDIGDFFIYSLSETYMAEQLEYAVGDE